jgi:type IV secretory pathway VirJ component
MFRKCLFFLVVIFYCDAQAQTNYIIHPDCTTTSDKPLVIFFTGDSGRSRFDEKLTDSLCANNIPLMCINSYKFFRRRKTPQQTLDSILPYIDLNLKKYNRQKFIFAGYSFGSEVVPFLYNLLSDEWKDKVEFIVLLSPSYNSDFKIHFFDRVGLTWSHWPYDVLHEIMKIDDKRIIVFWGKDEKKFEKKEFTKHNITVHHLKGGHRHVDVTPVIENINKKIEEGATEQLATEILLN